MSSTSSPGGLHPFSNGARAPRGRPRCADAGGCEALLARVRAEARAQGFEEGGEAALAHAGREESALLAEIAEKLADVEMIRREARRAALADLSLAMRAVVDALAPVSDAAGLAAETARIVEDAIDDADDGAITIRAPQEALEALRDRLGDHDLSIVADPDAAPGRARVEFARGGAEIDMTRLRQAVEAAVAARIEPPERELRDAG